MAHSAFTARQKAYAQSRSDRQVYTPQMIVNGTKPCIGSDRARVEASIKATSTGGGPLPVDLDVTEANGTVTIAIKDTPQTITQVAEIWVLPVSRSQTVQIGRGENRGRTVTYANVVRGMNRVGEWRGGAAHYQVSARHRARQVRRLCGAAADVRGPDAQHHSGSGEEQGTSEPLRPKSRVAPIIG